MLIIGSKLCLICALSAIALSLLNTITQPQITANKEKQEKIALSELIDKGTPGEKKQIEEEMILAYYPVKLDESIISYVLELSGSGYGGAIKIMAHYKPDGELLRAKIMDNKETPGLGKKCEDPGYMNKFIGKGGKNDMMIPTTPAELSLQSQSGDTAHIELKKTTRSALSLVGEWFFGKPKSGSEDSVTGATITFKGVSGPLAAGSIYIQSHRGLK